MNIFKVHNKIYKYESYWRDSKDEKIYDSLDKQLPWPTPEKVEWQNAELFITKLQEIEKYLLKKEKFKKYDEPKSCLLCNAKNITTGYFIVNNIIWEDGLIHYIKNHNIKPSNEFVDYIFRFYPKDINRNRNRQRKKTIKIRGISVIKSDMKYLKIDRNQILILDALMEHGSYRYYNDADNKGVFRYSEHAGLLDFNDDGLEKIIIYGNTTRVDEDDDDIFLPKNMDEAYDYEYIFHTHPATPKPGGRAAIGILYEFPSISDIFHFIDHYNDGQTQGSIVITAEGMYIIRKKNRNDKKIVMNENKFYKSASHIYANVQKDAVEKYGIEFNTNTFYSKISQDKSFINRINKVVNQFEIHIDFYSRVKDEKKDG